MHNKQRRSIPSSVLTKYKKEFQSVSLSPQTIQRCAPKVTTVTNQTNKLMHSIKEAIEKSGLKDGMTISFHHHLREGDFVFNQVMAVIREMGIKELTLAPSSLTNTMNEMVIECIKDGTVTHITSSGMRGSLGEFIFSWRNGQSCDFTFSW